MMQSWDDRDPGRFTEAFRREGQGLALLTAGWFCYLLLAYAIVALVN